MKPMTRRTLIQASGAGALSMMLGGAGAQATWPSRTIQIVVPFPPGGSDVAARAYATALSKRLGQTVLIDNKPGGGTVIGTSLVARAPADGYTFLFTSPSLTVNASLMRKLPYDTGSLIPVGLTAYHPFVLCVHPSSPARDLATFIKLAKQNPGRYTYASAGNGSTQHLGMELLKQETGIELMHVPYKGAAPAVTDLLGGQVDSLLNGLPPTLAHIESGNLRALAVEGENRHPALKGVPTFLEQGVTSFKDLITWTGIFAPKDTPADIVSQLSQAIVSVGKSPEVLKTIQDNGLIPGGLGSAEFSKIVRSDIQRWAHVIKTANVQVE